MSRLAHASRRLNLEALEDRTLMSTCHVTRLADTNLGMGFRGSLRYCINKVNAEPGPDIIEVNGTGTIKLTSALPNLASDIDLQGPGANTLAITITVTGAHVFRITSTSNVVMSGVTVSGAVAGSGSCGGGLFNQGTLTLNHVTVTDNYAGFGRHGGGICNVNGATLTVNSSTISDNATTGFFPMGQMCGAGIRNDGIATISNSTISGNSAFDYGCGAGIANTGTLTVNNSTIVGNLIGESGTGGGISTFGGGATLHMRNTILALNVAAFGAPNLSGALASSGNNLIDNTTGGSGFATTDVLNVSPEIGSLADNGGPTLTHALLPGSPAIDAGDNTNAPEWDQRGPGFPRIVNGTIDIGAFEVQATGISNPLSARRASLDPAVLITATLLADDDLD